MINDNDVLAEFQDGSVIRFSDFLKDPAIIRRVQDLTQLTLEGVTIYRVITAMTPILTASDATIAEMIAEKKSENINLTDNRRLLQ